MGKKYEVKARSAISGTPLAPHLLNEGVWIDPDRTLERTARWQLWLACYEIKVLYDNHWLLSAGCEEEGI